MQFARALLLLSFVSALQGQVETVAVVSNAVQGKFRLTGEFLPYQSVAIFARVNGYVEQVQVDVGSMVKKGQLLVVLSAPEMAAQAAADSIKDLQSYLQITAPFDGVITERLVHPGALVGPSGTTGPLLKLEQNSRLRLIVAVPEADVAGISPQGKVPFTVLAFPAETFYGTVARIPHSIDPKTRTMPVELDVVNVKGRLAPGMYPDVSWPVKRTKPSLLVPPTALVTTTERTFVIRLKDGRAEWVNVKKGSASGDLVEVLGDLSAGDRIVKRGSDEIREGSVVRSK
jgi:membrane fusion protein (multidrug efflux system)